MVRVDRLRILRDYLARLPDDQFDMGYWAQERVNPQTGSCGTVCCILGHAGLIPEFRQLGLKTSVTQNDVLYYPVEQSEIDAVEKEYRDECGWNPIWPFHAALAGPGFFGLPPAYSHMFYSDFYWHRGILPGDKVTIPVILAVLDEIIDRYSKGQL